MKSHLPAVKDTIVHKLVYAPHCYLTFVDVGGDYKKKHKNSLKKWFKYRQLETAKHQSGLLLGEFGLSPGKKDFDKYLNDIFYRLDSAQGSWTYWSSDLGGWGPLNGDRSPSPILNELLRIYPQAVAGELLSYSYQPSEHKFTMHMISDTSIHAPTIISIPLQKYPSLPIVNITSESSFDMDKDSKNNSIILSVKEHRKQVDIEIRTP
jgi:endoglycosylceramidase